MGPLSGIKVVELAGIGPAPLCAMILADYGADVLRIDRASDVKPSDINGGSPAEPPKELLNRGRRSIAVDLKHPQGAATVLKLAAQADVLIEGFRPGVTERLGLGPDECLARNPGLIYGRMTGWGQAGPIAHAAGHDLNYIGLAGCLAHMGAKDGPPIHPLNLIGDFGGGGMLLALGVCAALVERGFSGKGQVIDAAMLDGSALLMTMFWGFRAEGRWNNARGSNFNDGGAHYYTSYETADGEYVTIGSIEDKFYAELLETLGLDPASLPERTLPENWPIIKARFAEIFRGKTRAEWTRIMEGSDICFAPVLTMDEALEHPHNKSRDLFVDVAGVTQPAPAPRFSRTPGRIARPPAHPGQHTGEALADWGLSAAEIEQLREQKAIM